MGKYQRTRGAAFEREVANELTAQWGVKCKRNIGQARDGGDDITVLPFRIECKRRQKFAAQPWMAQVEAATGPGEIPVVVVRGDGQDGMVVLRFRDFIKLAREEVAAHAVKELLK